MEMNSPAPPCTQDHICWGAHASHPDRHRLEVDSLSVYYGSLLALNGISFSITCGHTLALMGPNGAGKSTLIKALAGLIRPDSGKILWNGRPLHDTPGEIAYLPQRSDVDWSFPITVRALVEMGRYPSLGLWKKFGRHDRDIVEKSLHALGYGIPGGPPDFQNFPAASSNGPFWRGLWRRRPMSSCWTNPSQDWTLPPASPWEGCWIPWRRKGVWSSPPITT